MGKKKPGTARPPHREADEAWRRTVAKDNFAAQPIPRGMAEGQGKIVWREVAVAWLGLAMFSRREKPMGRCRDRRRAAIEARAGQRIARSGALKRRCEGQAASRSRDGAGMCSRRARAWRWLVDAKRAGWVRAGLPGLPPSWIAVLPAGTSWWRAPWARRVREITPLSHAKAAFGPPVVNGARVAIIFRHAENMGKSRVSGLLAGRQPASREGSSPEGRKPGTGFRGAQRNRAWSAPVGG